MKQRILLACLLAAAIQGLRAEEKIFNTEAGSGVSISVFSPFEEIPDGGCVSLRVVIQNHSASDGQWEATFTSGRGYQQSESIRESLRVAKGQTGTFDILAPTLFTRQTYGAPMIAHMRGMGVDDSVNFPTPSYDDKNPPTVFVGMSEALTTRSWGPLKKFLEDGKRSLIGSPVKPELLGEDWRGLLGLGCLWITDLEFAKLNPAQKAAIRDWLLQGGQLFFCTESLAAVPRGELAMRSLAPDAIESPAGLGTVRLVRWKDELPAEATAQAILALTQPLENQIAEGYRNSWPLSEKIGKLALNVPLLVTFICLFSLVVGPMNLFWFAGGKNRHRLFWTTPLISVVASLALGGIILVQDGLGGDGGRSMLVWLQPEHKKAIVMQEQVARTGVLLSRRFTVPEDVHMAQLTMNRGSMQNTERAYNISGHTFSGDWFVSRWIQGQFIKAIPPSRAEVQLLNPAEISDTSPPVILSSIPATLKIFYLADAGGRVWKGRDIHSGERRTLEREPSPESIQAVTKSLSAGPIIQAALKRTEGQQNFFLATAERAPFIATLPSLRWQTESAVYVGHVSLSRP